MNILCVGDSYMPVEHFSAVFGDHFEGHDVHYLQLSPASADLTVEVQECEGDPALIAAFRPHPDIVVCHGAPITEAVILAHPSLQLICCARGGPVNVNLGAADAASIPVATTPGKNAAAVADLTLAFLIVLTRHVPDGSAFLRTGGTLSSTFDGARFLGSELAALSLGLVGYGQVGRLVAERADSFGVSVAVYDPYLTSEPAGITRTDLSTLLATSDVVSLHARATPENRAMMGAAAFAQMRRGAMLINTARESLVDEEALIEAIRSRHLAGAALDVIEPSRPGERSPLLDLDTVLVTPHIGGATAQTLRRGADMVAAEVRRFTTGQPLHNTTAATAPATTSRGGRR